MASTVFLALDGVDGESADDRHRGEIELESWAFGVSSSGTAHLGGGGAGVGTAQVSDLSVTKSVDLATPALLQAVASGRRLQRATLTARRTADGQHDYLVIVMAPSSSAVVSSPPAATARAPARRSTCPSAPCG